MRNRHARGGRDIRYRRGLDAMEFDRGVTNLDLLFRPNPDPTGHRPALQKGAVRTAEIFDLSLIVLNRQPRVPARNQIGFDTNVGIRIASQNIFAGRNSLANDLGTFL